MKTKQTIKKNTLYIYRHYRRPCPNAAEPSYFINKLATRILDFNAVKPQEIYDYRGGFEEYRAWQLRQKPIAPPKPEKTPEKPVRESPSREQP